MQRTRRAIAGVVIGLLSAAAASCSHGDDNRAAEARPRPATTAAASACPSADHPLRIVLVNDDGVSNPGIDALVDALADVEGVDVTIIAPADERSGSSDRTTPGGATYQEASTPGGHRAYAVNGFPADAVGVALDALRLHPHLFVSGVNPGENVGPIAAVSGTVGVGRTAVRRGYPALAVSAGFTFDDAQFDFAAKLARNWIHDNCDALVAGTAQADTVTSINVPQCPVDRMGDLKAVPRAIAIPKGENPFESSCDRSDPAPADDVAAIRAGYPAISQVPPQL